MSMLLIEPMCFIMCEECMFIILCHESEISSEEVSNPWAKHVCEVMLPRLNNTARLHTCQTQSVSKSHPSM